MARRILQIVVASFRPFTMKEINIALAIHSDDFAIANVKPKLDPSIDYAIRKICGPIVRISDSKVTLVHSTAKSFLLRRPFHPVSAGNSWKRSLSSVDSHTLLVDICTKYLSLEEIKNDSILDTIYPSDGESDDRESQCGSTISDTIRKGDPYDEERLVLVVDIYTKRYEFLDYSAKHWTEHYRRSERKWSLIPRIASLCDAFQRSSYYTWFYVFTTSSPMWRYEYIELSTLMVASYFGLEDLAAKEIGSGVRIDETDDYNWTALMYAAWSGSEGITKMLLKNGARVNAIGDSHTATFREEHTALMAAAANGHTEIVHLLIDHGAQTKTHTEFALSTAAAKGHESVVATLLGNGCDIEECDYYGQVPLHHACLSGRDNVFKLLISHGANHFTKDRNGRSALDMAVESGSEEIVKWLLAKGADINGTDCYGTTAFDLANFFGHNRVMRLLLDHGAKSPYVGDIDENQIQPKQDELSYNERLRSLNFNALTSMEILRCFPWVLRKGLLRSDGKGNFEDNSIEAMSWKARFRK